MVTKPGVGAQVDTTNSLTTGLVGCWLMNEGAGQAILDYSSLGQDTISFVNGPTWTTGPDGSALDFGTTGGVRILTQNFTGFNTTAGTFTIAATINPSAGTSNSVFSVGEQFDSNEFISLCLFNGSLALANDTSTGGINNQITGPAITLNAWHTVAISQSSGSNRNFMLDGAITNNTIGIVATVGTNSNLVFGATFENSAIDSVWDYKGKIGAIYIWNRALSNTELTALNTNPYSMFFGNNTVQGAVTITGPTTIQF